MFIGGPGQREPGGESDPDRDLGLDRGGRACPHPPNEPGSPRLGEAIPGAEAAGRGQAQAPHQQRPPHGRGIRRQHNQHGEQRPQEEEQPAGGSGAEEKPKPKWPRLWSYPRSLTRKVVLWDANDCTPGSRASSWY